MAKTTLINHETGYSSSFVTEDDKSIIHSVQNVKNVIDHAKYLSDLIAQKDIRHVAEIPKVIWEKAILEGWANDQAKWKEWLNNKDNECFRTWKGKI